MVHTSGQGLVWCIHLVKGWCGAYIWSRVGVVHTSGKGLVWCIHLAGQGLVFCIHLVKSFVPLCTGLCQCSHVSITYVPRMNSTSCCFLLKKGSKKLEAS